MLDMSLWLVFLVMLDMSLCGRCSCLVRKLLLVSMSIAGVPSNVEHFPVAGVLVMFGTYTMRRILVPGTHPVKGTY